MLLTFTQGWYIDIFNNSQLFSFCKYVNLWCTLQWLILIIWTFLRFWLQLVLCNSKMPGVKVPFRLCFQEDNVPWSICGVHQTLFLYLPCKIKALPTIALYFHSRMIYWHVFSLLSFTIMYCSILLKYLDFFIDTMFVTYREWPGSF